ncbi:isoleucine--tRNA ligase [Kordiimonas sp. SCSIO 12610]|uniref:isoleucine--tRNA ligase n=1 Tax=Kordiimonas sp. SCSIO 12610 TaxID=2829597 RepID=UPI00210B89DD|nr:isoleucine--tRNA ligase [Kordiimonas sp. SCSIO 12610]UTW54854.1 isoleucine--tRNA ligase [Kordiimonas sp. SCSIO 12610]
MAADKNTPENEGRDYRDTVFLPKTDFPMRAGLPKREPEFLKRWEEENIYKQLREDAKDREKFILHDGPPYANGDIHIGHAMNKVLKDVIVKSQQMMGKNSPYVPGWDCHGLPIEWKIEEKYRKKKKNKDEVDPVEFRRECREFAANWIGVQKEQFKRLGIFGDWENPYTTMKFEAEAKIVEELLKFAKNGSLYRGSKPVMWSPVEKTALAEAEVEYHDHTSTQIDVAFDVVSTNADLPEGARVVIWTTTPWTIPANRAVCYGPNVDYSVLEVTGVGEGALVEAGDRLVIASALVSDFAARAGIEGHSVVSQFKGEVLSGTVLSHPWRGHTDADGHYDFDVPMLAGDHVTIDAGTGFVHTAPGHGDDDYVVAHVQNGIPVPYTVNEAGCYYDHVGLVAGQHVYKVADNVCELLTGVRALMAKGKLVHSYPHSWRSKAPLIFRNTPQWFISMSKTGLRDKALKAIREDVNFFPAAGKNRIEAMVADRPDWVISRQRAWGVPITVFVNKATGEVLNDDAVNARIVNAVTNGGADAWVAIPAQEFLGDDYNAEDYEQVHDILDVWFDSGCTHAFVCEDRDDLQSPADLYLEGSDQHRGWFQSSLLESCGTRGVAPYKGVLTHGFTMDGEGRKMSKSLGNTVSPHKVIEQYGADILRLWVVAVDYTSDVRIGDEIMKGQADAYRKIRNTMRYMLGNLVGFTEEERLSEDKMPELERWVLHRLFELDSMIKSKTNTYDFNPVFQALYQFCIVDLSNFYFEIRKDCFYCDHPDDERRRAARTVLDAVFRRLVTWFAPVLSFTSEEVWQSRFGTDVPSVHRELWLDTPAAWQNDALAEKWAKIRTVKTAVNGKLEEMRRDKTIGSSLQARVDVSIEAQHFEELNTLFDGLDMDEIFITSAAQLVSAPEGEQVFADALSVQASVAEGQKCERCWVVSPEVSENGDLCNRCQSAVEKIDSAAV